MKWISALELGQWADTLQGRDKMPELVADLIWATTTRVRRLRFLYGDMGQVRGFDGYLDVDATSPFVPDEKSIWEFGTNGAGKNKAESDYSKRTKEVSAEDRTECTLVIVSPRTWDTPAVKVEDWLDEKNKLGEWKRVAYLDGPLLEDWLAQSPAVASRWARHAFKRAPQHGVLSTDEFWEAFSRRFEPALVEEVLLAGRESQAEHLLRNLTHGSGRLAFAADTTDEVIAFSVAAIRKAPDPVRKPLEARTLIVETEEAARYLVNTSALIYLPRLAARNCVGILKTSGPTVISAGVEDKKSDHVDLVRPTSTELGKAFTGMGMSESEGYEAARTCGRSLAILARQKPSGTAELPRWVAGAEALIPAMLAGAWVCSVEHDQQILSSLSQKPYDEAEDDLLKFLAMQDSPIERIEDLWATKAPVDAFLHLAHRVGRRHLEQFKAALTAVFQTAVASHKPPTADQPFVLRSKHDQETSHSEQLRNGLMTTLLHMAVLHKHAGFTVAGGDPQAFVDDLVRSIPGLSSDSTLMASLSQSLVLLAEASPRSFLEALERQLEGPLPSILPIFDEHPGMLTPVTFHCGLLWALEVIAWDAGYFDRAVLCLAKLAAIDPGGKLSNRPINSLRAIFLSWVPCTSVRTKHRLAVLQSTVSAVPSIAWPLLASLLPSSGDTSTRTEKPKFREYEQDHGETLTYGLVWESEAKIVALAIEAAGSTPARWITLINALHSFQQDTFEVAVERLSAMLNAAAADDRTQVWKALNLEVKRHQKHSRMGWAMSKERVECLVPLIDQYAPETLVENHTWLFDDWTPPVEGMDDEGTDFIQLIEDARLQAMTAVYDALGIQGVLQLADRAKLPHFVIYSALRLELSYDERLALFTGLLSSKAQGLLLAAGGVIADGIPRFENRWIEETRSALLCSGLTADSIARVIERIPENGQTWLYVETFGDEVARAYWTEKTPYPLDVSADELLYAVRKYREVGRPFAALSAVSRRLGEIPTQEVMSMLMEGVAEENVKSSAQSATSFFDIEKIIKELTERPDTTVEQMASLEFAYFPLLRHEPETLHRMLLGRPSFFMELVCLVFRAKGAERVEASELQKGRATTAYQLLKSLKSLPGQTDKEVNQVVLLEWCLELRRLAEEQNRQDITDQLIGQVLAHAPISSKDGAWPHEAVRHVIEILASSQVELGIRIERVNMRGAFCKAFGEGGDQERGFAQQAQEWAQASLDFVRTHAMLELIARSWLEDATRADTAAKQDALRY
ncbi:hypothetical protein [Pseudomonas savastanoi]|uniref:Uncharacterized protein n=1 Tax=Pseudomonas savastanoi TaxID=29438 RepID=A0AAW3LZI7_PSESS|nr:hypothetical protein [Pseudomonas savastanoi]KTC59027.1 hypothetical protein AO287_02730 [Pseudomonas savastanoi]